METHIPNHQFLRKLKTPSNQNMPKLEVWNWLIEDALNSELFFPERIHPIRLDVSKLTSVEQVRFFIWWEFLRQMWKPTSFIIDLTYGYIMQYMKLKQTCLGCY